MRNSLHLLSNSPISLSRISARSTHSIQINQKTLIKKFIPAKQLTVRHLTSGNPMTMAKKASDMVNTRFFPESYIHLTMTNFSDICTQVYKDCQIT